MGSVVSAGGGGSATVMLKVAEERYVPRLSDALQLTVVVPTGKGPAHSRSRVCDPIGIVIPDSVRDFAPLPLVAGVQIAGTWCSRRPVDNLSARPVIADASGVPHNSASTSTANKPRNFIPRNPL